MKLRELKFKNFKSFKDETRLENLKNFTILIGPNNTGKSNVIKVLEFLNQLSRNEIPNFSGIIHDRTQTNLFISVRLELTVEERQKIINILRRDDHSFSNIDLSNGTIFKFIEYDIEINNKEYVAENLFIANNKNELIQITKGRRQNNSYMLSEIDLKNHITPSINMDFGTVTFASSHGTKAPHGIFNGLNVDSTQEFIIDLVRKFFQTIKFIPIYRNLGHPSPANEIREFDAKNGNAPQVLNTYLQNDTEEFVRMTNELKGCLSNIDKITAPLSGNVVTLRISEPNLKTPTNVDEFSDGVKQTFGLFLLNRTTDSSGLICIEEPELNLHSDTQKKLFKIFRENKNNIQYIITTHSPTFTAIDDDAKTFLITKPEGSSQLREITEKEDLKFIKQELGIKNSDIYGYDGILFVEGYSEEEAVKIIAPALNYDEIGSKIRLVNLEGVGKVTRLKQFLEYLRGSDSKIFLMIDNHKEIFQEIPKFKENNLLTDEQYVIWDQNFEDTFTSEELINAMNNLCSRNNYKFDLTVKDLENERQSKEVYPIISNNFFKLNSRQIKKPELAKELAYLIVNDILNNKTHKKTQFELALQESMKKLRS